MATTHEIQYDRWCSPPPLLKIEVFWTFQVFQCSQFPPPHTLITVYGSHTGINVCGHCSLHLPKEVTEKPSVNHIGSSTRHQLVFHLWGNLAFCSQNRKKWRSIVLKHELMMTKHQKPRWPWTISALVLVEESFPQLHMEISSVW